MIFDEAAANLDPITEHDVWQALRALLADRAVLIITPRLIGLVDVDEIVVLQQGRAIERGRHSELIGRRGGYKR